LKKYDIVGLYLNPPDKAMVLCVDERSQTQALDRTQPLLPIGLGYVEGVPTTLSATAPLPCLPPWTLPQGTYSQAANITIAIRNIFNFLNRSMPTFHLI